MVDVEPLVPRDKRRSAVIGSASVHAEEVKQQPSGGRSTIVIMLLATYMTFP
jgi:hypothetical protein